MTSSLLIAGVDEAGRGPLAGPVVAGAGILERSKPIAGLADSKKLSAQDREILAGKIRENALAWAIGRADVGEIDALNILQATLLAMQRAINTLPISPNKALIDGNRCPLLPCPAEAIVRGDATVPAISAASIIAKVERDREMVLLHERYPQYGFDRHKGYPTRFHLTALETYGASPEHRCSFAPVRRILNRGVSP